MAATVAVRSLVLLRPGRRVNIVTHGVTTVGDDDASRLPRVFFVHGSCANLGQFDNQHEWCEANGLSYVAYDALGCGEVRPCTNVEFVFCKSAGLCVAWSRLVFPGHICRCEICERGA